MRNSEGGWSVASGKRRIKAHWRAASRADCDRKWDFHMMQAEQWRNHISAVFRGEVPPNLVVLDLFRSDPC